MLEVRIFLGLLVGTGVISGAVIPHVTWVVIISHKPVAPMDAICEICRFIHHINKVTVQFLEYLCIRASFFLWKNILRHRVLV
jgi:hypothetical protein